ncbi:uncharacterized protein [Miscanthus floridulus]|uniref:uncharacterized protein n=1 Tax=Miscanthus floridulus TaxID=154761 RepID=UPI0034594291
MHTHSDHDTRDPVLRTSPPSPGHEIYRHCSFVSAQTLLSRQMPDHATICNTPGPSSLNTTPPTGPFGSPVHGVVSSHHISDHLPVDGVSSGNSSRHTADFYHGPNLFVTSACGLQNSSLMPSIDPSIHRQSSAANRSIDVISDAHVDTSTSAKLIPLGHDSSSKDQLVQKVPLYHANIGNHPQGLSSVLCNPSSSASLHPCRDYTSPPGPNAEESCNPTIGEDNTCVFKLQVLDDVPLLKLPGTRLTKKPFKFCSPFKYGIMSRPPPFLELSLWMHAFLCADDSPLKSKTLMHFGTQSLTGQDIALSFADGKFIDFVFMDGFIKCITEDDLIVRPDCHGYRIFHVSDIIESEPSILTTLSLRAARLL